MLHKTLIKKALKKARKQKGCTQSEMSEYLGMPHRTYADIETGNSFPRDENYLKIKRGLENLGIKEEDIFGKGGDISPEEALDILNLNRGVVITKNPLVELAKKITDPKRQDAARMFLQSLVDGAEQEGRSKEQKKKEA